jgi:hypothetical protein
MVINSKDRYHVIIIRSFSREHSLDQLDCFVAILVFVVVVAVVFLVIRFNLVILHS